MKIEIKVPSMGESIQEVIIGEIFKKTGEAIDTDEEILEIETDKANQALYAPSSGILSLSVKQGDTVKIGEVIGFVSENGKAKEPTQKEEPKKEVKKEETKKSSLRKSKEDFVEELQERDSSLLETPDLTPPEASQEENRKKMSNLRKVIASKMVEAKNLSAMLTTFNEVDMSHIIEIREKHKQEFEKKHGTRLGYMSFFVKICANALVSFPNLAGKIEGDEVITPKSFDIGIAIGSEKGLYVPILRRAETLSFFEIERKILEFSKKASDRSIRPQDLQGGCFTITNGGVFGSLLSTPIINFPQSAILGMHAIKKRAVVIDDKIEIRPMMYLALSYDHRLIDGREAIQFLIHIKELIENPERLVLDL